MGRFTVDSSAYPLVAVTFDGSVTDEAFAAYLSELRLILDKGGRYGILFDATTASVPSVSQRRMQADYIRDERDRLTHLCLGAAFVIPSTLIRGSLTAIFWLQPPPFAHTVVSHVAEARRWVEARIAAAAA